MKVVVELLLSFSFYSVFAAASHSAIDVASDAALRADSVKKQRTGFCSREEEDDEEVRPDEAAASAGARPEVWAAANPHLTGRESMAMTAFLDYRTHARFVQTARFGTEPEQTTAQLVAKAPTANLLRRGMQKPPASHDVLDIPALLSPPHSGRSAEVRFSKDGTKMALLNKFETVHNSNFDNELQIWDVRSNRLLFTLPGEVPFFSFAQFSMDGSRLVTSPGAPSSSVKIWDVSTGACLHTTTLNSHGTFVKPLSPQDPSLIFFDDDSKVLILSHELWSRVQKVLIWDLTQAHVEPQEFKFAGLDATPDIGRVMTVSSDGSQLFFFSGRLFQMWNIKMSDRTFEHQYNALEDYAGGPEDWSIGDNYVFRFAIFSADGSKLAIGEGLLHTATQPFRSVNRVRILDPITGRLERDIMLDPSRIVSGGFFGGPLVAGAAFSADGTALLLQFEHHPGHGDWEVWDARTGNRIASFGSFLAHKAAAFSGDTIMVTEYCYQPDSVKVFPWTHL